MRDSSPISLVKRLAIPGFIVMGWLLTTACQADPSVRKQRYLDSGNQAFAEGKYQHAIIEYRNAVDIDGSFGEARKRLAEAYARIGDAPRAFEQYVRAADLLPNDVQLQLTAGTFLLASRKPEDALARADLALKLEPDNIQAHLLRGNALAGLTSFDDALKAIEEAIRLDPGRSTTFTHLGRVEFARGRRNEAESAFKRAVELAPKSVDAHLALANFYWAVGNAKETEAVLVAALAAEPDNGPANRAMAAFTIAAGRYRDAEQYLVRIAAVSDDVAADFALADYYIVSGRAKEAVKHLESLGAQQLKAPEVEERLARAHAAAGDFQKAQTLVADVLAKNSSSLDAQLLKGQLLMREGRGDEALAVIKSAAAANPGSAEAQFDLGRFYQTRGDTAAAEAAFQEVLRINPRAGAAQVEIAKLQLSTGNAAASVRTAEEAAKTQPRSLAARLTLVRSLLANRDLDRAAREIAELQKTNGDVAAVHTLAGSLALLRNDTATARNAFQRATELDARSPDALAGLIALDFKANDASAAKSRIEERLKVDRSPAMLLLAARTYWSAQDLSSAEKVLRQAIDAEPTLLTSYGMLAQLYVSQKKLDQARIEFENLATRQSKPVGALTMIGIILQAQGRNDLAAKRYEDALAIDSRAAIAANNLAWIHAESGEDLDKALTLAQTATSVVPESPEIMDTLGWVYYKKQLPDLAIPLFERSVEKAPDNVSYRYHLGLAYVQSGDTIRGRAALERALSANPDPDTAAEIRRVLAEIPATGPKR
jgi:tetratricopeptide (TPR) repeat protein